MWASPPSLVLASAYGSCPTIGEPERWRNFLKDLIEEADPLLPHAESATGTARELGARFGDADARKAVLHAWLAWQRNPGRPYGVAIKARFFRHDSDAAMRFVAWFGRLCGLTGDREG